MLQINRKSPEGYMTVTDAAKYMGVSRTYVWAIVQMGRLGIPEVRQDGALLVTTEAVVSFQSSRKAYRNG